MGGLHGAVRDYRDGGEAFQVAMLPLAYMHTCIGM